MKYTRDGGVIASGTMVSGRRRDHKSLFGLQKGIILQVVYPDDPKNSTKNRVEYMLQVKGQLYPNAVDMRKSGGIYNYQEQVRKPTEKSFTGKLDKSVYNENLDGEYVYVLFLEGNGDIPIIIGGAEHPRKSAYKKKKKSDGLYQIEEFNGVEISTDKDGNFLISQVGKKDPNGKILNTSAVGSYIKVYGTSKKIEVFSAANKITLENNKLTIDVTGTADINVSGNATIDAAQIQLNGSTAPILTGTAQGTDPVVDSIYGQPTVGVSTVKAG